MVYIAIAITVLSTVGSQLLFKKGVSLIPPLSDSGILNFLIKNVFLNGYIVTALLLSVTSIVSWMFALSKAKLSFAYPFMSLSFPLVMLVSAYVLHENIPLLKWIGVLFIMFGLTLVTRN